MILTRSPKCGRIQLVNGVKVGGPSFYLKGQLMYYIVGK
jgi:hypothetical protein